jgi:hypothetical protein
LNVANRCLIQRFTALKFSSWVKYGFY